MHRSPSERTESGRANESHPTGSLGIAISEAVEVAAQDPESNYARGSVLNHVLLHQTVIGQETIAQMAMAGEQRVILFGLCGHGHFDLAAYDAYLAGTLEDPEFSQADSDAALAGLPAGAPSLA